MDPSRLFWSHRRPADRGWRMSRQGVNHLLTTAPDCSAKHRGPCYISPMGTARPSWRDTMTTRTDIHRPSVIIPSDYQFVAFDYYGPDNGFMCITEQQAFRAHVAQTGGKFSDHDHGGTCDVCGASALY